MSPRPSMSAREKQVAAYKASKKKTAAAKQARADRERAANPFDSSNSTKIGKHSGLGDLYKSKDGKTLFTKRR